MQANSTSTVVDYEKETVKEIREDGFSTERWIGIPGWRVFTPTGICFAWAADEIELEEKIEEEKRTGLFQ